MPKRTPFNPGDVYVRKPADGRYGAVRVLWSGCVVWNTSKSEHGPWRVSGAPALSIALSLRCCETMGLPSLAPRMGFA
jgi:hypothetical protein